MTEIPEKEFIMIHQTMPIVCVDCIVSFEGKILLIKRKCEPMKGAWWFPGGRVHRGEKLEKAARRIVEGETGINIAGKLVYLGHGETQFDTDPFGHGLGTHTINFVYVATVSALSVMRIVLDSNHIAHSEFTFEQIYASDMHPYIKRFVALAEGVLR